MNFNPNELKWYYYYPEQSGMQTITASDNSNLVCALYDATYGIMAPIDSAAYRPMTSYYVVGHKYYIAFRNMSSTSKTHTITIKHMQYTIQAKAENKQLIIEGTGAPYLYVPLTIYTPVANPSTWETFPVQCDGDGKFFYTMDIEPNIPTVYTIMIFNNNIHLYASGANYGYSFDNAVQISDESITPAHFHMEGEEHFYKFTPKENGMYSIYIPGVVDITVNLFDSPSDSSVMSPESRNYEETEGNNVFVTTLNANTAYYVKVEQSNFGETSYSLMINRTKDNDLSFKQGDDVLIVASAKNITNFIGKKFVLTYDSPYLDFISAGESEDLIISDGMDISVESSVPGRLEFTVICNIPNEKKFSGIINIIKLKANQTGSSKVQLAVE